MIVSRSRLAVVFLLSIFANFSMALTVETFTYTGAVQSWVVPAGVTEVVIETWGAAGAESVDRLPGNGPGGLGGYATGTLAVTPGDTLEIYVGGVGTTDGTDSFNGGAGGGFGQAGLDCVDTFGGGGGGASDVRQGGSTLPERVIVAGGGGGGGSDYCNGIPCQPCGVGGGGGANAELLGADGSPAFDGGFGFPGTGVNFGGGAALGAGGAGGPEDEGGANVGSAGALGVGGAGSDGTQSVSGGGGGGGFYGGGGGGGARLGSGVGGGGGGGGSSSIAGVTAGSTTPAVRAGDGEVSISYTAQIPVPAVPVLGLVLLAGLMTLVARKRIPS